MSTQILGQNAQSQDIIWIDNEVLENQSADAQQWCLEHSAFLAGQISGVDAVWQNGVDLYSQLQPCQDWAAYFGFQCSFADPNGKDLFWKTGQPLESQSQECQDWVAANNIFLLPISKYNPVNPETQEPQATLDGFWHQGKQISEQDYVTQNRFNNIVNSFACHTIDTQERKLKPDGTAYPIHVWWYIKRIFLYHQMGIAFTFDYIYLNEFGSPNMFSDFIENVSLSEIEIPE